MKYPEPWGICHRSGRRLPLSRLVADGQYPGLLVDPRWRDPKHQQEIPPKAKDDISIRGRISPDGLMGGTTVLDYAKLVHLTNTHAVNVVGPVPRYATALLTDAGGETLVTPDRARRTFASPGHEVNATASADPLIVDTGPAPPSGYPWMLQNTPTSPPFGQSYNIVGMAAGAGKIVAVSDNVHFNGTCGLISGDSLAWVGSIISGGSYGICFGDRFVAVGPGGINSYSFDGGAWTYPPNISTGYVYEAVATGNGIYVAVASTLAANQVATSIGDGVWIPRSTPSMQNWRDIAFGNATFVAISDAGAGNFIMTSVDNGVTWVTRVPAVAAQCTGITFCGDTFIIVGVGGTVMTSVDNGVTWVNRTESSGLSWQAVCSGDGIVVATARNGSGTRAMVSVDKGTTWALQATPANVIWAAVCWSEELRLFIAGAQDGDGLHRIMTAP